MSDAVRTLHDGLDVLVVAGPGGVGKTTSAAATALAAAHSGRTVCVLTVDPARRLAEALGLDEHPDQPIEVWRGEGSLSAVMLDAEATFDRIITAEASSERQARAILANPIYRGIAGSLGGAQEYMAIERLHQLHDEGGFDLIVVDTPPSRHAIDLLDAPDRLSRFLGNPIYRALTTPGRSFARVTNAATGAFEWAVRRLAGPKVVEDTLAFFRSLTGLEAGFRERAEIVDELLKAPTTGVVVVTSPRAEPLAETAALVDAIAERSLPLTAVVVNQVHPLPAELSAPPDSLPPGPAEAHRRLRRLAIDERRLVAERLGHVDAPRLELPLLATDIHDLDGLVELIDHLA